MKVKNRNLSILDYFKKLQSEYLSANLRSKVYPLKRDKAYWTNKVMDGKKIKIEDIASRNNFKTIFNDPETRQFYENELMPRNSIPNFCYSDNNQKLEMEYYDLLYYFRVGSDILFSHDENSEQNIGKIKEFKVYTPNAIVVDEEGNEYNVKIDFIKRIL